MKIYIGSDHAGYEMKEMLKKAFDSIATFEDCGTYTSESVDYPDFAHKVADKVLNDPSAIGFLLCGSANGVAITANKHQNIRAALCWTEEISTLARQHNNANVCCIPARFITIETAEAIVKAFLKTEFEGGRHQQRVSKINC